jgi:aerotaxis receptor
MYPADGVGEHTEHVLNYYDKTSRKVLVTNIETPFPDGKLIVSRTDRNGVITHVNQPFVDISGYEEHELIGQPHYILRHPDIPKLVFQDLWEVVSSGQKWFGYVKNLRKDGGFYWVYATVVPNVRHGDIVGYTSVRRKPSRIKVEAALATYVEMLNEERG